MNSKKHKNNNTDVKLFFPKKENKITKIQPRNSD